MVPMAAPHSSPDRPPIAGFAVVLVAASMFGTLGPLSRFAYEAGMEPLAFVAWRGAIGLTATTAFVAWRISTGAERLTRLRHLDRGARVSLAVAACNVMLFCAFTTSIALELWRGGLGRGSTSSAVFQRTLAS